MNVFSDRRATIGTVLSAIVLVLCAGIAHGARPTGADPLAAVRDRLIRDGFEPRQVAELFQSPPPLSYQTIALTLRIREGRLNYDQFLTPTSLARAREFQRTYDGLLSKAQETYAVDRRVVVAILLVETGFGNYTGKTPTLGILTTFALMNEKNSRDRVWKLLTPRDRQHWGREAFDRKLMDRSQWAYEELRALLRLQAERTVRAHSLKGSVMGAVGWPQFLPSSLVRYGVDGDRDGRIDLYEPTDAIFSVANYLHGHGWADGLSRTEREAVIYTYNHSRPYTRTIIDVAEQLPR